MEGLEPPDMVIALSRAGQVAGLSPATLRTQHRDGRQRAVKQDRDLCTTRRWLPDYLNLAEPTRRDLRTPMLADPGAPEQRCG